MIGINEDSFHAALPAGLARAAKMPGGGEALAFVTACSTKPLENIRRGRTADVRLTFGAPPSA